MGGRDADTTLLVHFDGPPTGATTFVAATGGVVTTDGDYKVHTFSTASATDAIVDLSTATMTASSGIQGFDADHCMHTAGASGPTAAMLIRWDDGDADTMAKDAGGHAVTGHSGIAHEQPDTAGDAEYTKFGLPALFSGDGSGYYELADSADWALGTNDFTARAWFLHIGGLFSARIQKVHRTCDTHGTLHNHWAFVILIPRVFAVVHFACPP